MSPSDRIVLVTGVGKETGLGFAICTAFLRDGATVYLAARSLQKAQSVAAKLDRSLLGEVVPIGLDITSSDDIRSAAKKIAAHHGRLDVLVNNAALSGPFGELAATANSDELRAVLDVTLLGTLEVCQRMLPLIRKSPAGRIVNVSSGAGSHGDPVFGLHAENPMGTSYAVAKAALNALTVKLAREENTGLKINAVCPGFTATFDGAEAMGARPPSESAKGIVWAANLPADGPTAGFFRDGAPLPW